MAKRKLDADPDIEIAGPEFVEEFCTKPTFDEDGVQVSSGIGTDGKEYPDPLPLSPPVGFDRPPDLADMMRQMIQSHEYMRRVDEEGFDTFEEAGDFDLDDDPMPLTLHEAILQAPVAPPPAPPPQSGGEAPPSAVQASPSSPDPAGGGVASPRPPGTEGPVPTR